MMDSRRQTGDTWKAISGQGSYSRLYWDTWTTDREIAKAKVLRDTFTTARRMLQQCSIVDEPTANADSLSLAEYTNKGLSIVVNMSRLFNVCQSLLISDKIIPIFLICARARWC